MGVLLSISIPPYLFSLTKFNEDVMVPWHLTVHRKASSLLCYFCCSCHLLQCALFGMSKELSSAPVNGENSSAATKRPRIADSVSPTQEQRNSSLNTLPGHTCGHCGKACTAKGRLSNVIFATYVWVHAHYEGITK